MGPTRKNNPAIRRRGYGERPFRLSLRYLDSGEGSPWPFHELPDDDMADIGRLLSKVTAMTWDEIENIGDARGRTHGYRTASDLSSPAFQRFESLPEEVTGQSESLFRFKVTADKRLWGFVADDTFYVLWWDPRHEVARNDRNA